MRKIGQLWFKRILCMALAIAMCVTLAPNIGITSVFAAETAAPTLSVSGESDNGATLSITNNETEESYPFAFYFVAVVSGFSWFSGGK